MWDCYFASFGLIHCNFTMRFQKILDHLEIILGNDVHKLQAIQK